MDQFRRSKILYSGTPALDRRHSTFLRRSFRILFVSLALATVVAGGAAFLRWERLRIKEVRVSGAQSLSNSEIQEYAKGRLAGNVFLVIPRDHLFVVSTEGISRELLAMYPKVGRLSVKKTFAPALEIEVFERAVWGIGCAKTEALEVGEGQRAGREPVETTGPCFYIDRSGFAFEEVSSFAGALFPVLYKDEAGLLGTQFFKESDVSFFVEIDERLQATLQTPIVSVEFLKGGEDGRLKLKTGWSLIVPLNKNPIEWIPMLRALIHGEIKERSGNLDYVDLRFGNKVFYKFK